MKVLLIVYTIINGNMTERPLAIFAGMEDCRTTGEIISMFTTEHNTYGATIKYDCKPL